VMLNGTLFTGGDGFASEPGHQQINLPDGGIKRLEELASGTALGMIGTERAPTVSTSILYGQAQITGKTVGEAAQNGDPLALDIINEAGRYLGLGLVNLLHLFNPKAIVIGGSVSQLGDLLLNPAREVIQARVMDAVFWRDDLIRIAAMGDDVCLYGAALHAAEITSSL